MRESWWRSEEGSCAVPKVTITHDLYKRIETQAHDEQIPVSKLIEKLLLDATKEKMMYCPRCAFRF